MSCREALKVAIQGGARNLGRQDAIGQIAPGFAADIVGWRVEGNLGFSGAANDAVAGLILCTPSIGFVDLSIINGEFVVRDGKLLTVDLAVSMPWCWLTAECELCHGILCMESC